MDIIVKYKKEIWEELVKEISLFEQNTGMKVNYEKTTVYRIGSIRNLNTKFYSAKKITWSNGPMNILGVQVSGDTQQMATLNLDPPLRKAESILKMWRMRGLTLYGKILVVNALVASLFVHKLTVMQTVPDLWYKKYQHIAMNFIWNDRTAKISWTILTGNKEDGGLRLIDLKDKHKVLKMSWIFKLSTKEKVRTLADEVLQNKYGEALWHGEFTTRELNKDLNLKTENFWGDVLTDWLKFANKYRKATRNYQFRCLWLNSEITIGNKMLYCKGLIDKNLRTIGDLYRNKTGMEWEDFEKEYPHTLSRLQFLGLKSAIPSEWKKKQEGHGNLSLHDQIKSAPKHAAIIYKKLKKNKNLLNSKQILWEYRLSEEEVNEEINVKKAIQSIPYYTLCTKLRSFQYKILCNAILTNIRLKQMQVVKSNECGFCKLRKESITHLFVECKEVTKIWNYARQHWLNNIQLSTFAILFNNPVENPKSIENLIVLVVKYYIYLTKIKAEKLSIQCVTELLKQYKVIEFNIAKRKQKLDHHEQKWKNCNI